MPVQKEVSKEEADAGKLLREAKALVNRPNADYDKLLETRERLQDLDVGKLPKRYALDKKAILEDINNMLFAIESDEEKRGTAGKAGIDTFRPGDITPAKTGQKPVVGKYQYEEGVKPVDPSHVMVEAMGEENAKKFMNNIDNYLNGKGNCGKDFDAAMAGKTTKQYAETLFKVSSGAQDAANVKAVMGYLYNNDIEGAVKYANDHGLDKGGLVVFLANRLSKIEQTSAKLSGDAQTFGVGLRFLELKNPEELRGYFSGYTDAYLGAGYTGRQQGIKTTTTHYETDKNGKLTETHSSATKKSFENYARLMGGYGLKLGVPVLLEFVAVVGPDKVPKIEGGAIVFGNSGDPLLAKMLDTTKVTSLKFGVKDMHAGTKEIPRGVDEYSTEMRIDVSLSKDAILNLTPSGKIMTSKGVARFGAGALAGVQLKLPDSIAQEFANVTIYTGFQGNPGIKSGDYNIPYSRSVPAGVNLGNVVNLQYDTSLTKGVPNAFTVNVDLTPFLRYMKRKAEERMEEAKKK